MCTQRYLHKLHLSVCGWYAPVEAPKSEAGGCMSNPNSSPVGSTPRPTQVSSFYVSLLKFCLIKGDLAPTHDVRPA